jgi:hypothetical protein
MQYIYAKSDIGDISLKELTRAHIEKTNARKMVYDTIYKQCCEKIRYMNTQWHKTECSFIVPSIQIGMPLYKMETCVVYLMYKLRLKGFNIQFMYPNRLSISWKHALIRDLKENDKEWHKITEGRLYGDNDRDKIDSTLIFSQPNTYYVSERPALQNQQPPFNQLEQAEKYRYEQMKLMQSEVQLPSLALPAPNQQNIPSIVVEAAITEDERKEDEKIRRKRDRKTNDIMYRNEQARIADVISRKNQEALRALNFSKPLHEKHKKVLQIKPDK